MKAEERDELPEGWKWATIREAIGPEGVFIDGDWIESKDQDPAGDVRLIQLADVGDGYYRNKSDRYLTFEKATELGCTFLKPNDVLIARMPDPLGRACIFPGDSKACITVVDVCIVRPSKNGADYRWIMNAVNASLFRQKIESLQSGSTRKRISRGNLATLELPLPPLDEQRRIVARVEEFARRATSTQGLRQESVEYVDKLMPEARWQAFDELTQNGCELLPLSEVTAYLGRGRATVQGTSNVRLLKTRHVYPDGLRSFDDCRLSEAEAAKVQAERLLQPGDVLICSSAAGCLGRPGYFAGYPHPCTTDTHVAIARGDPDRLDPRFLFHYVRSPQGQYELLSREQGGKWQEEKVGFRLTELNLADLRTVPVPLPRLDEQRRIAAYLDSLQAKADAIRAAQLETQKELEALMPAVLDRAFRGEL